MQTCNYSGVEWAGIRAGLVEARKGAGFENPSAFSEQTGFDKSLAYRIEKGAVQPGLDTIEAWLRLTTGEEIGAFLTRVSSSAQKATTTRENVSPPVTTSADTAAHLTHQPAEASDARSVVAQGSAVLASLDQADLLEFLAAALVDAVAALRSGREIRQSDRDATSRDGEAIGVGGPRPPHVQRVK